MRSNDSVDIDELDFEADNEPPKEKEKTEEVKRKEELEIAMHHFDKAISGLKTQDDSVFYQFGRMCLALREYRRAIHFFNKVLDVTSKKQTFFPFSYYYRGFCYVLLEEFKLGMNDFKKIMEIDPEYPETYFFAGLSSIHLKNIISAINYFTQSINRNNRLGEAHNCRGYCYFIQKDYESAQKDFQKAIEYKASRLCYAHYQNGICYFHLGLFKEALECFEGLLITNWKSPEFITEAHSMRWACYLKLNETQKAEEAKDALLNYQEIQGKKIDPNQAQHFLTDAFQLLLFSEKKEYAYSEKEYQSSVLFN